MTAIEKLSEKWQIKTTGQFWRIMTVFSLAGLNVALFRKPIFYALGLTSTTALWLKTFIYILFVIPIYQISLLFYGLILGEFNFFWEKEKKLGRFLLKKFTKKYTASDKSKLP